MQPLDGRPDISYPCSWTYRVICTDEEVFRTAVAELVGPSAHVLKRIGDSTSGRYQRMELVVEVRDESHRDGIFAALGKLDVVRFVL